MQTIITDEFATTFWQLYEHCNKYIQIVDEYVEKNWEINSFLILTIVFLLHLTLNLTAVGGSAHTLFKGLLLKKSLS